MFEQLYQQVEKLKSVPGVTRSRVMALPDPLRRILNTLMKRWRRGQISLSQLAEEFNLTETETVQLATILVNKGFLYSVEAETGKPVYGIRFGQKRGRDLPLALQNALRSLKAIQLIEVKSDIGAGTRGANFGGDAIKTACYQFNRKFFENYPTVEIKSEQYLPGKAKATPFAKGIEAIFQLYQEIGQTVKDALERGALPVVVSGDHSTAGGTIAGIKMAFPQARLGVIWIDAHADIHTPYTTPSGNMHGMPVATAIGEDNLECQINHPNQKTIDYWNKIKHLGGISPKLSCNDLVYVAVRDTEPQEDHLIAKHQIKNFTTADVRSRGVAQIVREALEILSDCNTLYISFDVDSMDPAIVSEGTGTPVAGGLTDPEAGQLIARLIQQGKVCCFEICEINPMLEGRGNRMAETAFGILENATHKLSVIELVAVSDGDRP